MRSETWHEYSSKKIYLGNFFIQNWYDKSKYVKLNVLTNKIIHNILLISKIQTINFLVKTSWIESLLIYNTLLGITHFLQFTKALLQM